MDAVLVKDIMTSEVATLARHQSLPLAEEVMGMRRIRHLPVVDDENRLVGLVTHRDLLRAQLSRRTALPGDVRSELQLPVAVERIMTLGVWSVGPDTAALEAAQLLVDHRFGCLPIVDRAHRLLGIVTEADFLARAIAMLERDPSRPVSDVMSRRVVTLFEEQTLSLARELMTLRQIRHLPVVDDDDHLVGLVTHRDLLAAQTSALTSGPPFDATARVGEILRREVWTVSPDTPALEAARTLLDHRFGCLPVLQEGRVVGIVTEADFLEALVAGLTDDRRALTRGDAPVNYYMSERMRSVAPGDSLEVARNTMIIHGVSAVGVLEAGDLVGVISATDLLRVGPRPGRVGDHMTSTIVSVRPQEPIGAAARRMVERNVHRLFVVEGAAPIGVLSATDLLLAARDLRVSARLADYVTTPVFTLDGGEPVADATELLRQAGVTGVVVTESGTPVGMFTQIEALASRELPPDTPARNAMRLDYVTLPMSTPLYRAAGRAAALHARRVVAIARTNVEGILTGMDVARAIA